MEPTRVILAVLGASLIAFLSHQAVPTEAQIFDQLMNGSNSRNNVEEQSQDTGSRLRSIFKDMMSVNVP